VIGWNVMGLIAGFITSKPVNQGFVQSAMENPSVLIMRRQSNGNS